MRTSDFLIVGASKSGTTSLSNYISEHLDVEIVSNRLEFFGEYGNPAFPGLDLNDYLELFEDCPPDVGAGEKSVSYLYSESAPFEIEETCPGVKILMILRDPVERAYSESWHRKRSGVESLSFADVLDQEEQRIKEGARFELHYVNYGLYAKNVERYFRVFGRENVQVLLNEDLRESPADVCREAFEFLGVHSEFLPEAFRVYDRGARAADSRLLVILYWMARTPSIVSTVRTLLPEGLRSRVTSWMYRKEKGAGSYPEMDGDVMRDLEDFFREDVRTLQDRLDRDLGAWSSAGKKRTGDPA